MTDYSVKFVEPGTAASGLLQVGTVVTIPDPKNLEAGRILIDKTEYSYPQAAITVNAARYWFETYDVVILVGANKIYGSVSVRGQGSEDTAPGVWEADEEDPEQDKAGGHGKHR